MKKINFTSLINAPREKVWKVLWDLDTYQQWTSPFTEGSTVKTDNWKEGSKVLFLDGKGSGMVSEVLTNRPNEYMSFKHIGELKEGKEDTTSPAVQVWSGATENYTLTEKDGKTELSVDMDTSGAEFEDFLTKTWPAAMEKIKQLSETNKKITVESIVEAPVEKVWNTWTKPEHITNWCAASEDWHAPRAENDIREGGSFMTRMEAKDGSYGFDFAGKYNKVREYDTIEFDMEDGRHVEIKFEKLASDKTKVTETFDMENTNSEELQRGGWQSILDNFKKYTENAN